MPVRFCIYVYINIHIHTPGFYGNGKSFCYTVKEPIFTKLNVLGDTSVTPEARVGHTMVPDDANAVWIFGGENKRTGVLAEADMYKLDTARYVYTYIHTRTCMHTCRHAYMHACIHIFGRCVCGSDTHTYTHTYIQIFGGYGIDMNTCTFLADIHEIDIHTYTFLADIHGIDIHTCTYSADTCGIDIHTAHSWQIYMELTYTHAHFWQIHMEAICQRE
jgi:hypothetical protein